MLDISTFLTIHRYLLPTLFSSSRSPFYSGFCPSAEPTCLVSFQSIHKQHVPVHTVPRVVQTRNTFCFVTGVFIQKACPIYSSHNVAVSATVNLWSKPKAVVWTYESVHERFSSKHKKLKLQCVFLACWVETALFSQTINLYRFSQ